MATEPMDVDFCEKEEMQVDELSEEESENDNEVDEYLTAAEKNVPQPTFNQEELNDLIRDLGLPKDGAEYLAALKKKNLLTKRTKAYV